MSGKELVKLKGKITMTFNVPTKMSKNDINSWAYGGENENKAISDMLVKELGLDDKEWSIVTAVAGALNTREDSLFAIKDINIKMVGTVQKKFSCPECLHTPQNQLERYCSNCGAKLIQK